MRNLYGILLLLLLVGFAQAQRPSSEKYDLDFAEKSLLTDLYVKQVNPALCTQKPEACLGGDRSELAIALIAAHQSPEALRMLAKLHRLTLDGALGESFDQYLCEKGRAMTKNLAGLRATALRKQCEQEFHGLEEDLKRDLVGTPDLDRFCANTEDIDRKLKLSLEMAQHPPKSCEP